MTRKRASLCRAEDGEVAVEGAVTMLALVFLILGSVQFGLVFWNWNTMLLAVEEAGRYAMLYNPNNPTSSQALATNCNVATKTLANCAVAWANQNWGNNFTVSCTAGCAGTAGTNMTFTATYTFNFINSISLSRGIQVPLI
jgi:Flp pilus assembly protein TadG